MHYFTCIFIKQRTLCNFNVATIIFLLEASFIWLKFENFEENFQSKWKKNSHLYSLRYTLDMFMYSYDSSMICKKNNSRTILEHGSLAIWKRNSRENRKPLLGLKSPWIFNLVLKMEDNPHLNSSYVYDYLYTGFCFGQKEYFLSGVCKFGCTVLSCGF